MTSFVLSLGTALYANVLSYNNESVDALSIKNFSSPWARALQWAGNPEYEKIEWKLGSATFDF